MHDLQRYISRCFALRQASICLVSPIIYFPSLPHLITRNMYPCLSVDSVHFRDFGLGGTRLPTECSPQVHEIYIRSLFTFEDVLPCECADRNRDAIQGTVRLQELITDVCPFSVFYFRKF